MHIPIPILHTNPPPPTNQTMNSSLPVPFNPYPDLDAPTLTMIKVFAYTFLILAMLLSSLGGWVIKKDTIRPVYVRGEVKKE
ncbi:hypothetical protein DL95DRAFT_384633 [Leptodontidium sp. 2 PMI_412]|nr:hypothetical protein DL95DRAFT_384633 [Leptodontidium sp. 2 PMI_412]